MKKLFCILCLLITFLPEKANPATSNLQFRQFSSSNGLPNDEVQNVYQDQEGYIWIGTRSGLYRYDGYNAKAYKFSLSDPNLLTSNNILCITSDELHQLWVGTNKGLNILNRVTGHIRKVILPGSSGNNLISCLLYRKNGEVWIGTDGGLYRHDPKTGHFGMLFNISGNSILPRCAIKSLIEDKQGDVWIGTWDNGLFRYSTQENRFIQYPQFNPRNSAQALCEDSYGRIWVGTWNVGLYCLENPREMSGLRWKYYDKKDFQKNLPANFIYSLQEDTTTHTLWIGSSSGLVIMDLQSGELTSYRAEEKQHHIPSNEVTSILQGRSGLMWISTLGGGVLCTDTHLKPFRNVTLEDKNENDISMNGVRSFMVDAQNRIWAGAGTYGFIIYDPATQVTTTWQQMPEFSHIGWLPSVYAICQRRNGDICLGTFGGGILLYRQGERVQLVSAYNGQSYLADNDIYCFIEDEKGNLLIGTGRGLSLLNAQGEGISLNKYASFDIERSIIQSITRSRDGNFWIGSTEHGIIRLEGDLSKPEELHFSCYNSYNKKQPVKGTQKVLEDKKGRIWAASLEGGLFLYNAKKDVFEAVNARFNIPGERICSIEEDEEGCLWGSTNYGLVRIKAENVPTGFTVRIFNDADGLQSNFYIARSSYQHGNKLYFGSYKGFSYFDPKDINHNSTPTPVSITDIRIFNQPLASFPPEVREKISPEMPEYTSRITLSDDQNNFSIEFSGLSFDQSMKDLYAYKLEGYDHEWQQTDALQRFAYYNNLPSGTYTFRLKATNYSGVWYESPKTLTIIIRPPFWATWWAYSLYILLLAGGLYLAYRIVRNRTTQRNQLKLREMERDKIEELNHNKLQFFTNITHELLTPLTILSVMVDELKHSIPQGFTNYGVMKNNINRLIRLLQQILEFRKAESGNLKLRVSRGDIAAFVQREVESFYPLMKNKKLHLSLVCDPESILAYFDTDKLDKILYNLLSNAAKYNKENGFIQVNLSYGADKDHIIITVKDNGQGISPERQKSLFERFYEGDYRRFNTTGTGIGLSLTKDLVELHQGNISVESNLGKGTTFTINLPIDLSFFKEEEVDERPEETVQTEESHPLLRSESKTEQPENLNAPTVLLVEDNEELLQLMSNLLGREYRILTAANGKEGIVILENEEVELIVSDIMMPEMDGIEFCKYTKGQIDYCHIPIILLTAKNKEEDRTEAYESGADAFISKPFHLSVLHARIRNLLKTKERTAKDFKKQLVFEVQELHYTSMDEDFLQRAVQCVHNHLDDSEFDQQQFVEEIGSSKSTLYKKLKSLTGLNTSAFIRNIRLKAACTIAESKPTIRISELAYAVGFNDPKYFSSCFKKEFGMLPSEYMERFIPPTDNESKEDLSS